MQPCFSISGDRLASYYSGLKALGLNPVQENPFTQNILFISGVYYAETYMRKSLKGSPHEKNLLPTHRLDDGLVEAANIFLGDLMKSAKSRSTSDCLNGYGEKRRIPNPEVARLMFAWIGLPSQLRPTVLNWLKRQTMEDGWLRLCIGGGVLSRFNKHSGAFISAMIRKPMELLVPDLDEEQNIKIYQHMKTFSRNHEIDLEEI